MPELPEVETIRRGLEKYLVGHTITDVLVKAPKVFSGEKKYLIDAGIKGVRRFAKILSIDLSNNYSIVIHIKLTGQLIYRGPKLKNPPILSSKILGLPGKHTHVIFDLDRNGKLFYNDVRKFGWIKVVKTDKVETSGLIGKLGPEPFKGLTLSKFKEIVSKYKTPIKVLLMDQEKMGGIGNIYANDALWLSRIHPRTPTNKLSSNQAIELFNSILKVLKKGLKRGGASELNFVQADGAEGDYQEHFLAYGQDGKPCSRCRKVNIQRIKMGGRGTFFCPRCQSEV